MKDRVESFNTKRKNINFSSKKSASIPKIIAKYLS